jgi:hypothetical protein
MLSTPKNNFDFCTVYRLAPKFDHDGLIPVVTANAASGDVMMMGVMNADPPGIDGFGVTEKDQKAQLRAANPPSGDFSDRER